MPNGVVSMISYLIREPEASIHELLLAPTHACSLLMAKTSTVSFLSSRLATVRLETSVR